METTLILMRAYFKALSFVSPRFAAKQAFSTFQKVRKKEIRDRELPFYSKSTLFKVKNESEEIFGYELGDPKGPIVFLLHGWDSNAGSLSKLAFDLSKLGYRILAMNLPGHGFAERNSTNLFEAKEQLKKFFDHIDPKDGFHAICHSFGSAVMSYALSESPRKADKLIYLTSPNKMTVIFEEFKEGIQLGDKSYNIFCDMASELIGEDVKRLTVSDKLQSANFNKLTIIHDEFDKVISINNSKEILSEHKNAEIDVHQNIGHYRMLWNDEVLQKVVEVLDVTTPVDTFV